MSREARQDYEVRVRRGYPFEGIIEVPQVVAVKHGQEEQHAAEGLVGHLAQHLRRRPGPQPGDLREGPLEGPTANRVQARKRDLWWLRCGSVRKGWGVKV